MKNFEELVKINRSYRKYDNSKKIPRDVLLSFINISRFTPSSVNMQPLKYYVSCDDKTNALIRPHTFWAKMLSNYNGPEENENPSAYIIIFTDKNIAPNPEKFDKDVGIAAQTILLAAAEAGYGGCMIGNIEGEKICRGLNIPQSLDIRLILAVGVPAEHIALENLENGGSFKYYRDPEDVHHVPKRRLEDIIINK